MPAGAEFHVLLEGSLEPTVSTCSLIVDGDYSPDLLQLRARRARILEIAAVVGPGHGPPFVASAVTPR